MAQAEIEGVEEIKARVTAVLKTIPKEEFLASFQQVYEPSKACIEREEGCVLKTDEKFCSSVKHEF